MYTALYGLSPPPTPRNKVRHFGLQSFQTLFLLFFFSFCISRLYQTMFISLLLLSEQLSYNLFLSSVLKSKTIFVFFAGSRVGGRQPVSWSRFLFLLLFLVLCITVVLKVLWRVVLINSVISAFTDVCAIPKGEGNRRAVSSRRLVQVLRQGCKYEF